MMSRAQCELWAAEAAADFNRRRNVRHGLTKAERHALRQRVRRRWVIDELMLWAVHPQCSRVMRAEMRKRGYLHNEITRAYDRRVMRGMTSYEYPYEYRADRAP